MVTRVATSAGTDAASGPAGLPARADVVVVGAGAAGLATAACLRRHGVDPLVLDDGPSTGHTWSVRYDRLHLHTPLWQSALPGMPLPSRSGRWAARDDVVRYLRAYALRFGLRPHHGVRVDAVTATGDGWRVRTSVGDVAARQVVVATGLHRVPTVPAWPGASSFRGRLLHATDYREPTAFAGAAVVVVGAGNTGSEIAVDLADGGAGQVLLSVRTPPHVLPRTVLGVPSATLAVPEDHLPAVLTDPVNRLVERLGVGDLRDQGLPTPRRGMVTQARATGVTPTIDVGLVARLREGSVTVVAAVVDLEPDGVVLSDGRRVPCDVVVAATGYRTGLETLLDGLPVLDLRGRPTVCGAATAPGVPGLRFVGLRAPLKGILLQARLDARAAARAVARDLAHDHAT